MKLANRIGAAVLATAMVGTLLTGCGGGSASTTASTGDGTAAASSTESSGDGDNTYTMFMRSTYVDWIKELKWYDVAEERTGIHVDYISGPEEFNDVYSEIDQRVISGDLPDAVMTKLAQTNVYGPQGVFADLAPYIEMSGITQFIDGTRELTPDNWAAFQQEMNDMGLSRIEEIQLAAYQAMYGA